MAVGAPNIHAGGGNVKPPKPNGPMAGIAPPAAGGHGAPHGQHGPSAGAGRAAAHRAAGNYNWLQPLNPQQVTDQATRMVRAAYQPSVDSLNQQSKQAQAILSKQEADNQYYQQWLDSKTAALNAQQAQVEQTTNQLEQQLTGNQLNQFSGQANTLIGQANARAGNVSNNGQSAEFNGVLAQNQAVNETILGGASQRMLAQENISQGQVGAAEANTGAFLQAGAQKQTAAFNDAMTKIANARSLLSGKEGADIQKEIARLQGVQINLANSNRNFETAATKLGLQAANVQSQINTRAANVKLSQQRLQQTQFEDAIKNSQWKQTFQLDQQKYGFQVAKDLYQRQHGLGPYKPAAGSNGAVKPLSTLSQDTLYKSIQSTAGEINGLMSRNGLTAQQAYQAVQTGYFVASSNGKTVKIAVPRQSDVQLLNAAYNTSSAGSGLTQGDINALTNMGLTNINTRLPVFGRGNYPGPH